MRRLAVLFGVFATLLLTPAASVAAPPAAVFDGAVTCEVQGPPDQPGGTSYEGQTWCGTGVSNPTAALPVDQRSTVKSFDGMPIDVNFALPDEDEFGAGPHPLVMMFHGYGELKKAFTLADMQFWLNKGYAVFAQTNRGFGESCGTQASRDADPAGCADGWVRLDDTRYEVRDAQVFAGMLVDEGLVPPDRIAASGGSYGGGMSMSLAALRDRIMLPDDSYAPWQSPDGIPIELAVAIPNVPWTDLAYSLAPNGSNLDYLEDSAYYGPLGVMKQSIVNGLYTSGLTNAFGNYAPSGLVASGDLNGWIDLLNGGEPYEAKPETAAVIEEITSHHSSYYIDHSQPPAPVLISSGFTDDIFPINEATRFYNRTMAEFPNAKVGLFFGDFGHQRAQSKAKVSTALFQEWERWIDWYLADKGSEPAAGVTTFTQTCPKTEPDGGPFVTDDWVSQSPGELRHLSSAAQRIEPWGGSRGAASAFNPVFVFDCATTQNSPEPDIASYDLDPAPAGGYTMMGSPTVIANLQVEGDHAQIAARLVDVTANGAAKTLVARGIWRTDGSGPQVFQLNANGWTVREGRHLRLELLPADNFGPAVPGSMGNFTRPTDGQASITVSDLELRIPVQEQPGALDGLVTAPAPRVLPDRPGAALAPGNETIGSVPISSFGRPDSGQPGRLKVQGKPQVKNKVLIAKVRCVGPGNCAKANIVFKGVPKGKRFKLAGQQVKVAIGKTRTVRFKLTKRARNFFKDRKKKVRRRGKVRVRTVKGPKKLQVQITIGGKASGKTVVRRTGPVR